MHVPLLRKLAPTSSLESFTEHGKVALIFSGFDVRYVPASPSGLPVVPDDQQVRIAKPSTAVALKYLSKDVEFPLPPPRSGIRIADVFQKPPQTA